MNMHVLILIILIINNKIRFPSLKLSEKHFYNGNNNNTPLTFGVFQYT